VRPAAALCAITTDSAWDERQPGHAGSNTATTYLPCMCSLAVSAFMNVYFTAPAQMHAPDACEPPPPPPPAQPALQLTLLLPPCPASRHGYRARSECSLQPSYPAGHDTLVGVCETGLSQTVLRSWIPAAVCCSTCCPPKLSKLYVQSISKYIMYWTSGPYLVVVHVWLAPELVLPVVDHVPDDAPALVASPVAASA
jgi:hypothetical protein